MFKHIYITSLLLIFLVFCREVRSEALITNIPQTIKLPLNNWSSQRVISKALGAMIQSLGQGVEYKNISSTNQWGALAKGLVHVQIEVWQAAMATDYERMMHQGHILDVGTHRAVGKEDWWYPDYVEEFCPGLPDWRAMNSCAEIFSTATSNNKGVYYAGPWDYGDGDIIRALELNFTIHRFKNATEVWQKLTQAIEDKQPIMLLNWTPNWTDTHVKGKFVAFPEYQPECETEPSWGLNQHLLKDCANPSNGWLKKVVWPGLENYSPCVFRLVKNIDLTTKMISDASALVIIDGYNEEDAAKMWLRKHHKSVEQWLTLSCNMA